jgi:hypothetical protein
MTEQGLVHRIHQLMLTDPEKLWSYDELAYRLNSRKKVICSRCLDLYKIGVIDKVLIASGKLRGKTARVSIKKEAIEYPSWLSPSVRVASTVKIAAVGIRHHRLDDPDGQV